LLPLFENARRAAPFLKTCELRLTLAAAETGTAKIVPIFAITYYVVVTPLLRPSPDNRPRWDSDIGVSGKRGSPAMWVPTREEAVAIYARFCQSHYGVNAREKVTSRATQLGRQGDSDGERIWREVAQEIEKTKPESLPLSWSPQA
jgi:hypothetical protein